MNRRGPQDTAGFLQVGAKAGNGNKPGSEGSTVVGPPSCAQAQEIFVSSLIFRIRMSAFPVHPLLLTS
jgi:hypothetical protein